MNSPEEKIRFVEQKMDVITREMNHMLGSITTTITNIVETHKLFTQYVVTRLEELDARLPKAEADQSGEDKRVEGKEL